MSDVAPSKSDDLDTAIQDAVYAEPSRADELAPFKAIAAAICDVFDLEPDLPINEQSNFGSYRPTWEIIASYIDRGIGPLRARVLVLEGALRPFANFDLSGFTGIVLEVVPSSPENPARRIEPILAHYFRDAHSALQGLSQDQGREGYGVSRDQSHTATAAPVASDVAGQQLRGTEQ